MFKEIKKKKKTSHPPIFTTATQKKLKRLAKNRVGVSCRKLANTFGVSESTINRYIAKIDLSYRKRAQTPKYSEEQAQKAKKLWRKLVIHLYETKKELAIDNEKYFGLSCDEIPGNSGFYTDNIEECPDDVRLIGKEKYPVKVLV